MHHRGRFFTGRIKCDTQNAGVKTESSSLPTSDLDCHLIHGSSGPQTVNIQMEPGLAHSFLQVSPMLLTDRQIHRQGDRQTDRQTDRETDYLTSRICRPHL